MKTDIANLKQKAKMLVSIAKDKDVIKPHTDAFKDFPVEKEIHKGKKEFFKK